MSFHFLHPNFLWVLIALLIPIIIHLFNFKRFEKVYFSNLKFLKQLNTEHKRKSKIKKWLILLLRLLALAALIIAFAQPYLTNTHRAELNPFDQNPICIYIDNSFSMNAETEKGIALEVAKNLAITLINSMPYNTAFKVYTQDISHLSESFQKNQAIERIQAIQTSPRSVKLSKYLQKLQLDQAKNTKYYIFSDFQKSQSDFENIQLDSTLSVNLIPIKVESTQNLFLDSCWLDKPNLNINEQQSLNVKIENNSNQDYSKIPIQLSINNNIKSTTNFEIQPHSNQVVKLHFLPRAIGNYSAKVEIKDFPITFDNTLYFSYSIKTKTKILAINGVEPNQYISKLFHSSKHFTLQNIESSKTFSLNLDDYQLIILNELESIESVVQQQLNNYLLKGGNVLILPAIKMSASINQFLKKISALQFDEIKISKQRLSDIEFKSEIYKDVFEEITDNARFPDIYKYYTFKPSTNNLVEVIWKTAGSETLFSRVNYGKGSLYQMSMNLNNGWTNLVTHPILIPTLINIARSGNRSPLYYTLGKNSSIHINQKNQNIDDTPLHIINRSLKTDIIPEQINHFDNGFILHPRNQIKFAGNYNITKNDSVLYPCSFNYSRQESSLNFYNSEQLETKISRSENKLSIISVDKMKQSESFHEKEEVDEYWVYFLFLGLLLYLAESVVQKIESQSTTK
ncbi:BatA domain-containing protein [Ancylomarina longa]|uniref:VWA domain-containing protein n=1 Tax=Ancylomarina longa TaxID=2487017 RepID=A0A434AF15_9BACT|nr:BatA domain-containing protein [Ancylomarina longa]RUT72960.1 VWA domain-containing protein [Ancylomarina longa]